MKKTKYIEINYIYFGLLFLVIAGIHGYAILLLDNAPLLPLFLTTLAQCFWECSLILTCSFMIQRHLHTSLLYFFKALVCILVLAHQTDFILIRLMGTSVWHFLYLLSFEVGVNIIETMKASNIPHLVWFIGIAVLGSILGISLFFFYITDKLLQQKKFRISYKTISLFLILPPCLMAACDKIMAKSLSFAHYETFRHYLPLKQTIFTPEPVTLSIAGPIKAWNDAQIEPILTPLAKRPPIFLFIIESLREDFITPEIAPNLYEFKHQQLHFPIATSGGNASHCSWFTIFHSQFPLRFSNDHIAKTRKNGSKALQTLKQLGYKIHVYTSAELVFFQMGESIFGKGHHLADTFEAFPHEGDVPVHKSDFDAMHALQTKFENFGEEGHVHIVFLDSTHFDYSWPKEMGDRFQPIDSSVNYIHTAFSKSGLEKIKNRYRNSIYYVDSLLAPIFHNEQLDNAIIVVTGDHGESFYEHGHIFHASTLHPEQIYIPLYYKFGKDTASLKEKASPISSHIDIFPTLIDYLTGGTYTSTALEGESIFKQNRWPYTITSRYNAGQNPFEFHLQGIHGSITLRYPALAQLLKYKSLPVAALESPEESAFLQEAESALNHLFAPTSQ